MAKKIIYWLPTLVWASLIFFLSSRPTIATSAIYWQDFTLKKTAHLIEYSILSFLLYRSLKNTTSLSRPLLLLITITITILYAASDEYHQSFIPGRGPHIRDVFIDSIGAILGSLFFHKFDKKIIKV